jgi:AraC-like DNA-binding protein/mannose-6-phosphate isomerase-like protein (cupin superfamily)
MRLKAEKIQLLPGESFRLLQWRDNPHDVELIAAGGARHPFSGSGHEWHYHAQMELTLVLQGTGTLFIGDSIASFKAPDLVLIGPYLPHYWHMRHRSAGYALQFDFGSEHPFWQFPETRTLAPLWKASPRGVRITGPAVDAIAGHIRAAAASNGMGRLVRFFRVLETLADCPPKLRRTLSVRMLVTPAREATYRGLQRAIAFVFRHFQDALVFRDVLREAAMSKATFERHFRAHTGKNLTEFVAEVRLNAAARQLVETDHTIGEIALASGFNTLSHFNHQFRARYRTSPRAFRSEMRRQEKT